MKLLMCSGYASLLLIEALTSKAIAQIVETEIKPIKAGVAECEDKFVGEIEPWLPHNWDGVVRKRSASAIGTGALPLQQNHPCNQQHPEAVAQTNTTDPSLTTPQLVAPETEQFPTTNEADINTFSVRGGIRYTTEGAGYEQGFTSFEAFLPLSQTPGKNITFLEGRLLLQNNAKLGANIVLGQRFFGASTHRVYGGYIAFDERDTDKNSFNQLGLGFETLGEDWDFRINGYIPIGTTRQQTSERFTGNSAFRENVLLLDRLRRFESAGAGVDAELGGKLAKLGQGSLRGYGGVYYINAEGSGDVVGVRGRLEARPTDAITLNLSVQNDSLFDTRVVASIGLTFSGSSARGNANKPLGLDRMGESVVRQSAITVVEQTKIDQVIALNSATGQPWRFQHVVLGVGTGNGTFETPFNTVQNALSATLSDRSDIVYVQPAANPGIPKFTIPEQVQVLSTAPVQVVDTVQQRRVQLPLSGTGVLPIVTGFQATPIVTMGNHTTLSGFELIGNGIDNGIVGTNSTVNIRENTIKNVVNGISLNSTGNSTLQAAISDNIITNSTRRGITIQAEDSSNLEATVSGNSVSNTNNLNSRAVSLASIGENSILRTTITGNEISNTNGNNAVGLFLQGRDNGFLEAIVQGNKITQTSGRNSAGLSLTIGETSTLQARIFSNTIAQTPDRNSFAMILQSAGDSTLEGTILGNTISNTTGANSAGIALISSDNSTLQTSVSGNTISNTTGTNSAGIVLASYGNSRLGTTISGNTISNSTNGRGLVVQGFDSSQMRLLFDSNIVTGSGKQGMVIFHANTTATALLSAIVQSNTFTNNADFGFQAIKLDLGTTCIQLNNNSSSTGFELRQLDGTFNSNSINATQASAVGNIGTFVTSGTFNLVGACSSP